MEIYGMTGEKLGTIGAQPAEEELPEWKKAFLSTPSVSVRKGIASNFDTPYEDTSTLVLTAPSGKFVDIRFPLSHGLQDGPLNINPSFWAFSGTVNITFLEPSSANRNQSHPVSMLYAAHAIFEHDIDSKRHGHTDEGDMFLLPNGDTMEVGIWTNPMTKKYEMYKEYWTEAPSINEAKLKKSPCLVAEIEPGHDRRARGIIIRIGPYCQGIYDAGGEIESILVERWHMFESISVDGRISSTWTKDPRSNAINHQLPCDEILEHAESYKVDDIIGKSGENTWRISEILQ